jgi:hypothetical protein
MPKSTSTFIKSKMNKDTDSRILPPGEYRDAQNVSISKSEGSDVGALENVLGNRALVDINDLLGATVKNLEVIGHFMDIENSRIFIMLTNYNDSSPDQLSNFAPANSGHYIYSYNIINGTTTQLVSGEFLNFSKTHPIYGINILEDLLFWTDDRNQPRKINIESALASPSTSSNPYYTTEDQISVAKYYPYNPIRMYKKLGPFTVTAGATSATFNANSNGLVEVGDIVTSNDGTIAAISQQPVVVRSVSGTSPQSITTSATLTYLGSTEFTFYRTGMRDVVSEYLPQNVATDLTANPFEDTTWPGDPEFLTDKFVRFSYRYKFDDGEYSLMAPFTQPAFIPKQDGYFINDHNQKLEDADETKAYVSTIVDFMENKVNSIKLLVDTPSNVKDLHSNYKVTELQILYKQSDETNVRVLDTIDYTDPSIANYQGDLVAATITNAGTTYVDGNSFTVTGGTGVGLTGTVTCAVDPGPVTGVTITNDGEGYSNGDVLTLISGTNDAQITITITNEGTYEYDYQSRKPILSLPSNQVTRVYDQVPIKALAQAVTGNRVVYANFLNKHTSPKSLNYSVINSDRLLAHEANSNFSTVQYPTHSLKQNRTYQVGIVLADKYGRQSDVILSSIQPSTTSGAGGSTVFSDYRTQAETTAKNVLNWFGESFKITFTSPIPESIATPGYPGLHSATNPTGWYSYKVVVKQQQQEYYNVYLPSILSGYPFNTNERDYTAHVALYSDNINKIPKDLVDVGPEQKQFRGSERMWGRLENFMWTDLPASLSSTRQYYPELITDQSIMVGTMSELDVGVRRKIRAQHRNATVSSSDIYVTSYDASVQDGMGITSTTLKSDLIAKGETVTVLKPGSGYSAAGPYATTTDSVAGTGLTVTVTSVDADGAITGVEFTVAGTGYEAGDVIELTGAPGTGAVLMIDTVRITNYEEWADTTNTEIKARISLNHSVVNMQPNEGLEINPQGETRDGTTQGTFFNYQTNPFITKLKTQKPIGQFAVAGNEKFYNRLSVYETQPEFSNIDIFWETSSAGLISDLNTAIAVTTTTPTGLKSSTGVGVDVIFDFNENDASGSYITDTIKAINGTPAFITSNISMALVNVYNSGHDISNQFTLENQGLGGYRIKTTTEFVADANPNANSYAFNIEVSQTVSGNTYVYPFYLKAGISNTVPTITPVAPATCGGVLAATISGARDNKIATFNGVNGSASTNLNTQDLTWGIRNSDGTLYDGTAFELRDPTTPTAGQKELWVKSATAAATYTKKVRVMDGPGAYVDCQLTFTIT